MAIQTRSFRLKLLAAGLLLLSFGCEGNGEDTEKPLEPQIHGEYPIESGVQLSPPIVAKPIHECAAAVHVYGFMPHAEVRVYANANELIGQATPDFAFADIALSRALVLGERISATQTVNNLDSAHSVDPVEVGPYPSIEEGLGKPEVGADLYACGRIVPVRDLTESVRVRVFEDGNAVGQAETPGTSTPVWTSPLNEAKAVTAQQIACEDEPAKTIESPLSEPVTVKAAPDAPPTPTVRESTLIVGADAIALDGLLVGAQVRVKDQSVEVGGGWATGSSNWVPLSSPLVGASIIRASQELCGNWSLESDPVEPTIEVLEAPEVAEPICEGQQYVVMRGTVVNANVIVLRDGNVAGYGGAGGYETVLALSAPLQEGEKVAAIQYMGPVTSPTSASVTVVGELGEPAVDIVGGEPFFGAEGGEKQIAGPVFPRGRGPGPLFRIQACCREGVRLRIVNADGDILTEVPLTEVFPGYFTGRWDWQIDSGWTVPDDIPVGLYGAWVTTGCPSSGTILDLDVREFFVIFNPDDVQGPARFSFDETAVWFGVGSNATRAILYHLHPDDARVFKVAINAAQGETSPLQAAQKISDAEEGLFAYDLGYHGTDVLNMLLNETHAQCADDASFLTALLRAVGIPAHPATADAALETGAASWTFDTWTEFLVPSGESAEWLVLHPHEYPNMSAETRAVFGTSRSVATKSFNDLVVMADETWVWSQASDLSTDISWSRNACSEPKQALSKKNWIEELCQVYWNPNHWACGSSSASADGPSGGSSNPLRATWDVDRGDLAYGRTVSGSVAIDNASTEFEEGELAVELVTDLLESKAFPDEVLASRPAYVKLEPGATESRSFEFRLPPTLQAGHYLYLRTRLGEENLSIEPLDAANYVDVELQIPESMRVGDSINLAIVVANRTKQVLEEIAVSISAPFAITLGESAALRRPTLQPGETWTIDVEGSVVAPITAGSVMVRVDSANGGWAEALVPFSVPEEARPERPIRTLTVIEPD